MTETAAASGPSGSLDLDQARAALTSSSTTARIAQLRGIDEKISHKCEPALCPPNRDQGDGTLTWPLPCPPSSRPAVHPRHPQGALLDPCLLHRPSLPTRSSAVPSLAMPNRRRRHPHAACRCSPPGDPEAGHCPRQRLRAGGVEQPVHAELRGHTPVGQVRQRHHTGDGRWSGQVPAARGKTHSGQLGAGYCAKGAPGAGLDGPQDRRCRGPAPRCQGATTCRQKCSAARRHSRRLLAQAGGEAGR